MEDFLIYLLKSAGLLTAFLLFYNFLLKKDTTFITNRKFLLGGLLTSAILPAVYFTKTVIIKAQPSEFQLTEAFLPATEIAMQEPAVTPLEIIAGIYLLGVAVMIIRLLLQLFSLSKVLFSGNFSREENANLIETKRQVAPFSFLNYIVYNPDLHSRIELEYILKHEREHVQQGHTLDVLLGNLNLIYQWFNPFAWLYLKNIQQNLEFIADREAVKKAACKKEYQKALVKISVENFNLAITNNFYQSLIKKRIIMLNKSSTNQSTTWKTILIVPALLSFVFLFNIKTVAQVVVEEEKVVSSDEFLSEDELSVQISNTKNKEQLEAYIRMFKKFNVQLEFKNVTRNNDGLITGITASFLDKNNNGSGSITRLSENGIKGFVFYYSEKEGPGFRNSTDSQNANSHAIVRNLGMEPLVIIEGKQYSFSQLEGKAIKIMGDVTSLPSATAIKTHGDEAKDGALIISKGQVLDDFDAEIKEIDKQDQNAARDYIRFEKGNRPMFISLNKNLANASTTGETGYSVNNGSNKTITIQNLKTTGKEPIYILNGKVLGSNVRIDTMDQANIKAVNVLKGYSATAIYGKDAKDGAIIITTRKAGDTTAYSLTSATYVSQDSIIKKNTKYSVKDVNFIDLDSLSPTRRKFVMSNTNAIYYDAPLFIVDGKKMPVDFNISRIDNDRIEIISVIKGAAAIEKYGEEGKGGAIEVTTKKNTSFDMGTLVVITSNSTPANLKEFESRLKGAGIQVDFEKVKRNKQGIITNIKIIAKHKSSEMSASFSETEGIQNIFVGLINGKLVVSSNPPRMN